jgi:hypothetical protein
MWTLTVVIKTTKKRPLFQNRETEKKELEYCHVAMDSFGTWLSNGFIKCKTKDKSSSFWGGGQKRSKKKNFDDEIKEREILGSRRLY